MTPIVYSSDENTGVTTYIDQDTGRPLKVLGFGGQFDFADEAPGWIDSKGLYGSAGSYYTDGRFANNNDYLTWTDPANMSLYGGTDPSTGLLWDRTNPATRQNFLTYQDKAQAGGQAEAARQDAASGDDFGGLMQLAMLAAAIYSGGSAAGLWGGLEAGAAGAAGAGLEAGASLGGLGSGTFGVDLAGMGAYGATPAMAGTIGSGLSGTTLASLGLDASALAGAAGAGAVADSVLPSSMTDLGSNTVLSDAFPTSNIDFNSLLNTADTSQLGSGVSNLQNAITTGIDGNPYVDPFSSGSITGSSALPNASGISEYLTSLGIDPTGISTAMGGTAGAGTAASTVQSWLQKLLSPGTGSGSGAGSGEFNWGNALAGGLMQYLKMKQANDNLSAGQDAYNRNITRSPSFMAGLTPTGGLGAATSRLPTIARHAVGGYINGPSLISNNSAGNYAAGGTSGQSDKIPAMLSDGEYVMDADTVAALGDGNNAAGAAALEQMRMNIRKHKRAAPVNKIPPKAKRPEQYLKGAK